VLLSIVTVGGRPVPFRFNAAQHLVTLVVKGGGRLTIDAAL
jgi:hypothetical protein